MKKAIYILTLILVLGLIAAWITNQDTVQIKYIYVERVLNNLNQIKTASYISTSSAYTPYDTIMPVYKVDHYFKEYVNPKDTFVGASFIRLNFEDTTKMSFCYNGYMRARVHWDEKTIEIDSFRTNRHPYRNIWAPFFTRAKTIINYISETEDSISFIANDFGDSLQFSLTIYDDIVEFFGNRTVHDTLHNTGKGKISKYELWINKSNYLPYRIKRNLPHNISVETCRNVNLNKDKLSNFIASSYFPDYPNRKKKDSSNKNDLLGKVAPDWILKDADDNTIALEDLKSKIILIQFTGIGCGPCHASIPFLKKLVKEYKNKDFEFVSIETWSSNMNTIKKYRDKNQLNYKFLKSTKDIAINYQILNVPIFYFLDQNRVIRKVIEGYGKGSTDKKIRDAIEGLI